MKAQNQSRKSFLMTVLSLTAALFNGNKKSLNEGKYVGNGLMGASGGPFYVPRKHTIQSYRNQQRLARKRRK
jgi:hypothetical protein